MKKTFLFISMMATATGASAFEFNDMDLITARNDRVEINYAEKTQKIEELTKRKQRKVYGTNLTYDEFAKVGQTLFENVLTRTRDNLRKLYTSGAHNAEQNEIYNDFFVILEPEASTERFKSLVIYNPNGAKPDDSFALELRDVRRMKRHMDTLIAGGLEKYIAENGADFQFFTTKQNEMLTAYINDLQSGRFSKLKRIENLKEFIEEFDQAAKERKIELSQGVTQGDYYLDDGYVLPVIK